MHTCICMNIHVYIYLWVYMCIHFLIALSNKNAKKQRAVNTPNSPILDSNTIPNTKEPEFLREMVDSRPRQGIQMR